MLGYGSTGSLVILFLFSVAAVTFSMIDYSVAGRILLKVFKHRDIPIPGSRGEYAERVREKERNREKARLKELEAPLAFPGAEGEGAYAKGGRGGDIYHVTSLNDSSDPEPGTLRYGLNTKPSSSPLTIVFNVSGTIVLSSPLTITTNYLTIAGQTAPGDGIALSGWTVAINKSSHIVIRFIRVRPGDIFCSEGYADDALTVINSTDVIIDHVSTSWSVDETLSVVKSHRVTVQWSIISESLFDSCHEKGSHGYASLVRYGDGSISFHHNLFANHEHRMPRLGDSIKLDFVGNILFNWGRQSAGYSMSDGSEANSHLNLINNYAIPWPTNNNFTVFTARMNPNKGGTTSIYESGNIVIVHENQAYKKYVIALLAGHYIRAKEPYPMKYVSKLGGALGAYYNVLYDAGASFSRDTADKRVVEQVRNIEGQWINTQEEVGGWPELKSLAPPLDTDMDGIPDKVEKEMKLDYLNPNDSREFKDNSSYTHLEIYHNSLVTKKKLARADIKIYPEEFVQIVMGMDSSFLVGTMSAMQSIVQATTAPVRFHLFLDDEGSIEPTRAALECLGLAQYVDTLKVFRPPVPGVNRHRRLLSLGVNFVRLFLGSELPGVSRALWLDGDILVRGDIAELWRFLLDDAANHTVAAKFREYEPFTTRDSWTKSEKFLRLWVDRYAKFPGNFSSFNAGVMMVNLDHLRANNYYLQKEMIWWMKMNGAQKVWNFGSQPLCSILAALSPAGFPLAIPDQWHSHDWGWRVPQGPYEKDSASLLHYSGDEKPWLMIRSDDKVWLSLKDKIYKCLPYVEPIYYNNKMRHFNEAVAVYLCSMLGFFGFLFWMVTRTKNNTTTTAV